MSFADKTVLITGASAGVGGATARAFAALGANLILVARGRPALETLQAELNLPERVRILSADVAEPAQLPALIETAVAEFGGLDVLVNNAGANSRGALDDVDPASLAQIVDVNLRAPILLSRLALPELRKRKGVIINVASLAGRIPLPHEATYSATKFGLRAFSFALAEELRGTGVSATVVSPGPIDTGFIMDDLESVPDLVFSPPMSTAEEIAAMIVANARDGRRERAKPALQAFMATFGYLAPGFSRGLRPLLEKQGRRNKEKFRARKEKSS